MIQTQYKLLWRMRIDTPRPSNFFTFRCFIEKIYYQVSASILDENTKKRELTPFDHIPDHYEKVILTMDRTPIKDFNGIKNINIIDFLLQ